MPMPAIQDGRYLAKSFIEAQELNCVFTHVIDAHVFKAKQKKAFG